MEIYDLQEKENKWRESPLHIYQKTRARPENAKLGDLRQNTEVRSELRENGPKSREPAIAGNCRARSRKEGLKIHEVRQRIGSLRTV